MTVLHVTRTNKFHAVKNETFQLGVSLDPVSNFRSAELNVLETATFQAKQTSFWHFPIGVATISLDWTLALPTPERDDHPSSAELREEWAVEPKLLTTSTHKVGWQSLRIQHDCVGLVLLPSKRCCLGSCEASQSLVVTFLESYMVGAHAEPHLAKKRLLGENEKDALK